MFSNVTPLVATVDGSAGPPAGQAVGAAGEPVAAAGEAVAATGEAVAPSDYSTEAPAPLERAFWTLLRDAGLTPSGFGADVRWNPWRDAAVAEEESAGYDTGGDRAHDADRHGNTTATAPRWPTRCSAPPRRSRTPVLPSITPRTKTASRPRCWGMRCWPRSFCAAAWRPPCSR